MGLLAAVVAFVLDCAWTQAELLVQAVVAPLLLLAAPLIHVAYLLGSGPAGFARSRRRVRTKAYLITGASQGVGAALAVRLAKDRATCALYLVGRSEARMSDTRRACASVAARPALRIFLLEADVQDRDAMRRAILQADQDERDAGGAGLTAVVANAGVTQRTLDPTSAAGFAVAADILNINMMGTIHTVEPAVDIFATRGHGQIVIISSVASFCPGVPAMTAYSSSKVAQRVFGECLRTTLEPHGVDVLTVCPGFVRTRMSSTLRTALPESGGTKFLLGLGLVTSQALAADIASAMERRGVGLLVTPRWWRVLVAVFAAFPYQLRTVSGRYFRGEGTECFVPPS